MLESIRHTFSSIDWSILSENLSNDRLVGYFTHPYGMALLGVLMLVSVLCKWRLVFVVISAALAVSFLARYTLAGEQVGPNHNLLLFAGGAVILGAFIIYFVFIRED